MAPLGGGGRRWVDQSEEQPQQVEHLGILINIISDANLLATEASSEHLF